MFMCKLIICKIYFAANMRNACVKVKNLCETVLGPNIEPKKENNARMIEKNKNLYRK